MIPHAPAAAGEPARAPDPAPDAALDQAFAAALIAAGDAGHFDIAVDLFGALAECQGERALAIRLGYVRAAVAAGLVDVALGLLRFLASENERTGPLAELAFTRPDLPAGEFLAAFQATPPTSFTSPA